MTTEVEPAAGAVPANAAPSPVGDIRQGVGFAAAAYILWGLTPIFFKALHAVPAIEIVVQRMFWSLPFIALLVAATGRLGQARAVFKDRRALFTLAASALLLSANWFVYIWSVNSGQILQASLAYYINPLVSVGLGVVFLSERLSRWQIVAVALAALGVLNQAVAVGVFPWAALFMATSFGAYGLIRKTVAADSRTGLLVETIWLAPIAVASITWLELTGSGHLFSGGAAATWLLVATGPVTVLPLLLFAMGARRLKLSTMGLLQYFAPTLQFICAVAYGEAFTVAHGITFGLIWLGLAIFTIDGVRRDRRTLAASPASGARPGLDVVSRE